MDACFNFYTPNFFSVYMVIDIFNIILAHFSDYCFVWLLYSNTFQCLKCNTDILKILKKKASNATEFETVSVNLIILSVVA